MSMVRSEQHARFLAFARGATPELLRYGLLLTGNRSDAEDLVQATFERVLRRWSRIDSDGAPLAYCRKTMARLNVDSWRSFRRREWLRSDAFQSNVTSEDPTDRLAAAVDVALLLSALPARQRTVLILRFFDDLSEREVAAAMGTTVGTVKSQTAKALDRLRRITELRAEVHP
jgi:RNA polymerase sigma-70 factor (sigma-E family)